MRKIFMMTALGLLLSASTCVASPKSAETISKEIAEQKELIAEYNEEIKNVTKDVEEDTKAIQNSSDPQAEKDDEIKGLQLRAKDRIDYHNQQRSEAEAELKKLEDELKNTTEAKH